MALATLTSGNGKVRRQEGKNVARHRRSVAPRNERERQARDRALHALNLIRRKGYGLGAALSESDTSARTFHKYLGSEVLPSKPGQRVRVTKEDRRIREMLVTTGLGDVAKKIHGSENASINAAHRRGVLHYLRKGDDSLLTPFQGKSIDGVELLTDPELISALAEQGAIKPEQFYASVGGEG
jgi:hypothetical protein